MCYMIEILAEGVILVTWFSDVQYHSKPEVSLNFAT